MRDLPDGRRPRHGICILLILLCACAGSAPQAQPTSPLATAPASNAAAPSAPDSASRPMEPAEPPPGPPCPISSEPQRDGQPSRQEVIEQMHCIRSDVRACGQGRYSSLTVTFAISGRDGQARVEKIAARTGPVLEGTPESDAAEAAPAPTVPADAYTERCVARAVARLRFAPFARESLAISAPFSTR